MSPEARTLAQGAAVAAEPFGPELAAAAAELDDPLGALDELLAADLIRATDTPRRFRFRHPIVRHAIYSAAGRRLAARRARPSGRPCSRARAPPPRSARTTSSSARSPATRHAIDVLAKAAAEAAPRAPAAAANWWAAALRLLPADSRPSGSSCSSRARPRSAPAASWPRAATRSTRRSH